MPNLTEIPQEIIDKIAALEMRVAQLEGANTALRLENEHFREQLKLAQRSRFGSSSEKGEFNADQTCMFYDLDELPPPVEPTLIEVKAHTKTKRHLTDRIPDGLPIETIVHELPADELDCAICGHTLHVMGSEVVWTEIKLIPAKAILIKHVQLTYSCRNCEKTGIVVPIIKAPLPKRLIPGSHASPEAVAYIMMAKYILGIPLYRQEKYWYWQGIRLSRQTMSNWAIKAAEWLRQIYELLHKLLMEHEILAADETRLQVLREPGKTAQSDSWMWVFRTGSDADRPIILMEYQPNRKGENAKNFLEGHPGGYLHADGYAGYNQLCDKFIHIGCMAHARRKFHDALMVLKADEREGSGPYIGRSYCDRLFAIERRISELPPEEKYQKRQELAKPILEEFKQWLQSRHVMKNKFGEAIRYMLNNWQSLNNYLLDGRLDISNNITENSIRPFAISRKNFLFSNTPAGAEATAITCSIIETAKANRLNVYEYLRFIFTEMPKGELAVEDFLPWNDKLPDECRKPYDEKQPEYEATEATL